jgi:PDZ domain-containing protein
MDQSKIAAAVVVLSKVASYPQERGPGALIEQVGEGCPAHRRLFPGDLILRIAGEAVDSRREASRLIEAVPPGRPIAFRVEADGAIHEVSVARGRCPGIEEPLLGIALVAAFPFDITIESGNVGGPSAGLMWAIGLYDLLTPGDLTSGRTIAGTGTIDLEGNVGPIGGIRDKVVAARDTGADILLVPEGNMAETRGVDLGDLRLIAVATFEEAVEALQPPNATT